MKERLISDIQRRMLPYLNNEQLMQFRDAMDTALQGVTVSDDESAPKPQERNPLEAFITAKRIEGCSEKTLTYYRNTIVAMTAGIDKTAQQLLQMISANT